MLLSQAAALLVVDSTTKYISRLSWPEDTIVYLYKPQTAALLNKMHNYKICKDEPKLIKCSIYNTDNKYEYRPSLADLLASDWQVSDKKELYKKYNLE